MKSRVLPAVVSMAICFSLVSSACSSKLPPETLPAPVQTTAETVLATETEPVETTLETEAEFGPLSTPQVLDVPVELYGQLRVEGTNLVSESGEPVQLRGMSSGGLQSCFQFFNDDVCDTLIQDWGCTVIRLAMTSHGLDNGYTYFPDRYFLDSYDDPMYWVKIEDAAIHVSGIVGHEVEPTVEAIDEALEDYQEEHEDEDLFYSFHEFTVVDD